MSKPNFTLETISQIDEGVIAHEFNQKLEAIRQDLHDRPNLDKDRTIVMEVKFRPSQHASFAAETQFRIKHSIPPARSRKYEVGTERRGMSINPASPSNIKQGTLDELDQDEYTPKEHE
ncbi:MAG: hypothetical protein ACX94C_07585 [Phycisphaerales bacterium]